MRLLRYCVDQFRVQHGCNPSDNLIAMQRLRESLSEQKHQLSDKHIKAARLKFPALGTKTLNMQLTRNSSRRFARTCSTKRG
eukprot:IDg1644t1